jgi:hypothetical protein
LIVSALEATASSVCPSAAARATADTPIPPFAPGRFSTMTLLPHRSESF